MSSRVDGKMGNPQGQVPIQELQAEPQSCTLTAAADLLVGSLVLAAPAAHRPAARAGLVAVGTQSAGAEAARVDIVPGVDTFVIDQGVGICHVGLARPLFA